MRLDAIIDELMQNVDDVSQLEKYLGWKLESIQARVRAATAAELLAYDGFRVPRGIMQVEGATGEVMDIAVLIDGCAAKHMASVDVKMTVTGESGARNRCRQPHRAHD